MFQIPGASSVGLRLSTFNKVKSLLTVTVEITAHFFKKREREEERVFFVFKSPLLLPKAAE